MPFTVTKPQPADGKLYIKRLLSGDFAWTADKANATPLSEADAESIASGINKYASVQVQVEGITHREKLL
jgi:hypothetical protein